MADFNPSTPTVRGMEWRPITARQYAMDSGGKALACRFRSPGAVTITSVHQYLATIAGTPGVGIEIVDTLIPTGQATLTVFPGTLTGATTAGWTNFAAGGVAVADVNKSNSDATGDQTTTTAQLRFRGNASALSGKRILNVVLKGRLAYTTVGGGGISIVPSTIVAGVISVAGSVYNGGNTSIPSDTGFAQYTLASWYLDPSTGLPWTMAAVNNVITTAGPESFGIATGPAYGSEYQVSGMWLEITYVTENRHGSFYTRATQVVGWTKQTLASTSALVANTWYWLIVTGPFNTGSSFGIPILGDPNVVAATSPSSAAGEHRQVSELATSYFVATTVTTTTGEMFPFLLDDGAVKTQSQPYAEIDTIAVFSGVNLGTEITTAAGASNYGAIKLVIGWQDPNTRPDAPLLVDVRRGGGMLSGGGTLDVTGTLNPQDSTSAASTVVQIPAAFTSQVLATQYALYITSAASSGRGWTVSILDTRSDVVTTTTVANVEGASQGGQTDGYFNAGTAAFRWDAPASLVIAPNAPTGLTATPKAAV